MPSWTVLQARFGAALVFIALLTQSIALCLPMPSQSMGTIAVNAAGGMLCQYNQDRYSQDTAGLKHKADRNTGHKSVPCPVCLAFHLMGSLMAPPPIAIAYPRAIGPPSAAAVSGQPSRPVSAANRARAPPPAF